MFEHIVIAYIETPCSSYSQYIQEQLFELGYKWASRQPRVQHVDKPLLALCSDNTFCYSCEARPGAPILSYTQFMNEARRLSATHVKLNDVYTATVTKEGIRVACQVFPFTAFYKLQEAVQKFNF